MVLGFFPHLFPRVLFGVSISLKICSWSGDSFNMPEGVTHEKQWMDLMQRVSSRELIKSAHHKAWAEVLM